MNVDEEFRELKNFVSEFREEIILQQKELDSLAKELDKQRQELSDKQRYLDLLETRLQRLENLAGEQTFQPTPIPAQKNFDNYQLTRYSSTQENIPKKNPLPISTPQKNSDSYPSTRYDSIKINPTVNTIRPKQPTNAPTKNSSSAPEIISEEFNALANVQDRFSFKNLRDEFVQKYSVRAFSCTNFEARMSEPIPPPQFGESENISSEYWAINYKGSVFLVLPNVRQYTNNHHTARAMGEVFESNFEAGKTYKKIFVQQPAFFECNGNVWRLKIKGKLRLE